MEAGTSDYDGQVLELNPLQNLMNFKKKSVQTKSRDFFEEFKHLGAVQPLSIHWLVPKKIYDHVDEIKGKDSSKKCRKNLSQVINQMVSIYNKQLKKGDVNLKVSQYTKDKSWKYRINGNDIQILIYSITTSFVKALSRQTQRRPKKSKKNDSLVFLIQSKPQERVMALTTGNAWQVVLKFCNYSFPIKVTEKVGDPRKVICLEKRMIFGSNIKEKVTKGPQRSKLTPLKTTDLYYRVENLKCDLKDDSSLFQIISCLIKKTNESEGGSESENENEDIDENEDDNENEYKNGDEDIALSGKKRKRERKINRIWIEVTKKGLRIGRKLPLLIYPNLFVLFANYVENMPTFNMEGTKETADPMFAFLKFFQPSPVLKKILDEELIDFMFERCLHGETPDFDVRHPHCEDYLLSNLFKIKIGDRFKRFGSMPPEIGDIIEMTVNKNIEEIVPSDKEKFKEGLFKGQLKFELYNCPDKKPKELIIDCIEGQLHFEKAFHCKIGKMWYILNEEYLSALNEDFQRLLKEALIAEKSEWWLHKRWKDTETLKAEDKERMKTEDRSNGESKKEET
ncbi:unnamed protein product [Bemisia tabaci]|uniref:Uncharacterized protein n=1 Tax=Bemisia tabaci TaxID=7038 RepID=A0A9P0AHU6_BEMTA|nr:unnamed protein product [Bemisia tabaci]